MEEPNWIKEVWVAIKTELREFLGIRSPSYFDKGLSRCLELSPALDLVVRPPMDHKHSFKLRCKILGHDTYMFQCSYCRQLEMVNTNRFGGTINPRKDISNAKY